MIIIITELLFSEIWIIVKKDSIKIMMLREDKKYLENGIYWNIIKSSNISLSLKSQGGLSKLG